MHPHTHIYTHTRPCATAYRWCVYTTLASEKVEHPVRRRCEAHSFARRRNRARSSERRPRGVLWIIAVEIVVKCCQLQREIRIWTSQRNGSCMHTNKAVKEYLHRIGKLIVLSTQQATLKICVVMTCPYAKVLGCAAIT